MPRRKPIPFDWNAFWLDEGEGDQMRAGAERMAGRVSGLIESFGATSLADVGCGSGRTLLALAKAHPGMEFTGYDASEAAVRGCEDRARSLGLRNVEFARGSLPTLAVGREFDLVLSIATLHYIKDVRTAVRSLWAMVRPGGSLVFNYPNRFTMHAYRKWVAEERDPTLERRFGLVLAGENLLTLKDVRELLGTRPRSLWRLVGEEPTPANVCVVARRPGC